MEHIENTFKNDVRNEFLDYLRDNKKKMPYKKNFIEDKYNSISSSKYLPWDACMDYINSNFDIYFEMEEVCVDYYSGEDDDPWMGRGLIDVVNTWRYVCAKDYLEDNYETIIQEYEDGLTTSASPAP